MKILVIEDEPVHRKLARLVLSDAGHVVSEAQAAENAFAAIKENRPDLILLDLGLPGMDGFSLVRKFKADPDTRDIYIVTVTSYPEKYPQATASDIGCDAYLVKPIDTRKLPLQLTAIAANGKEVRNGPEDGRTK